MNVEELKELLPSSGMKAIAEKTGIPYIEVTRMFNGLKSKRTPRLIEATYEYLAELETKRKKIALDA